MRNTNGLPRLYFPKGTDLSRWSAEALQAVAHAINNRPRKTLRWNPPADFFEVQMRSLHQPGVASTGSTCRLILECRGRHVGEVRLVDRR